MPVLEVFHFAVEAGKLNDLIASLESFRVWTRKRPDLFGSMRSYHVYSKTDGGKSVRCVEVCEFASLTEVERNYEAVKQDKEYLTSHLPTFTALITPGTLDREIWTSVV